MMPSLTLNRHASIYNSLHTLYQIDIHLPTCLLKSAFQKPPLMLSGFLAAGLIYLFSLWVPLIQDFYFEWRAGNFFQSFKPRTLLGSIFNLLNWGDDAFTVAKVGALWAWLTLIISQFFQLFITDQKRGKIYHFCIALALSFIFAFSTVSQMTFGPVRILDSIPYFLILASYLIYIQDEQKIRAPSYISATLLLFLATLIHEKSIFDIGIVWMWLAWKGGIKKASLYIFLAIFLSALFLFSNKSSGTTGLGYAPNAYLEILSNGFTYFKDSSFDLLAIILGGGALWIIYTLCAVFFIRTSPTQQQRLIRSLLCIAMVVGCFVPLLVAFDTNRLIGLMWLPTFLLLCEVGPQMLTHFKKWLLLLGLAILCILQFAVPPMLTMPPLGSVVFNSYAKWFAGPRAILVDLPVRSGQVLEFKDQGSGSRFLSKGWHGTESWGVWGNQAESLVTLQNLDPSINRLSISLKSLNGPANPKQEVEVFINGKQVKTIELLDLNPKTIAISLPDPLIPRQPLEIQFRTSNVMTPKEAGISAEDNRPMGISRDMRCY